MTHEQVQLAEAIRESETAIGAMERFLRIQAFANEAMEIASRRLSIQREASARTVSALAAYAESLLAGANALPPTGDRLLFCGVQRSESQECAAVAQRISDAAEAARRAV